MGHVNVPNCDEDDIFPERAVEVQERDQHNHENDRVRQHYPRAERAVWVQQRPRTPPQGQLHNSHLPLPPGNLWISRPAAPAYQQPWSPPPYNPHRRLIRPPPIGVSIPIVHWPHRGAISLRVRSPPIFNLVRNPPLFFQRLRGRNIPPPMLHQLRMPNCLSFQLFMSRQPPRWQNRIPWSNRGSSRGYRPRPPAIKNHSMRSKSRQVRLNQRQCTTNDTQIRCTVDGPQQAKDTEEEKDDDDIGEPRDQCEAYKDLHYDKDSDDDDDDDFNSNNQDFPNIQIVL